MTIPLSLIGFVLDMVTAIKNAIDAGEDEQKQLAALMDAADRLAAEIERRKFAAK